MFLFCLILTEASNASVLYHPDDPSIARGGRISDSFAPCVILTTGALATGGRTSDSFASAKPVPVSESPHPLLLITVTPCQLIQWFTSHSINPRLIVPTYP